MKMKKLLALLLAILMMASLVACGSSDKDDKDDKKKEDSSYNDKDKDNDEDEDEDEDEGKKETGKQNASIKSYINANKDELLESMEDSFATSSGLTCTSDIEVIGNGFVIYININELDDVDKATKDAMQDAYDALDSTFEGMLDSLKTELEEIEYFEIKVCDVDGDVLATIHAGE